MFDLFEYPNITSLETKEQVKELQNYLIQFKETLEFALMNISTENLSADLIAKLNGLGADIETSKNEQADQLQQIANNQSLTISDVINSKAFITALENVEDKIPTDYIVSGEQTETSQESGGLNVFTFSDSTGETKAFEVRNGNAPTIEMAVNFETGNLEYGQT